LLLLFLADFFAPFFFEAAFFFGAAFFELFLEALFLPELFLEAVFFAPFFFGTLSPSFLASDKPMAIACFRLVTFFPLLPLFNLPSHLVHYLLYFLLAFFSILCHNRIFNVSK